jgi:hypothetical protein
MDEEREEKKDFVVRDRRLFTEEGEPRSDEVEKKEEPPPEKPLSGAPASESDAEATAAEAADAAQADQMPPLPEVSFATFVLSLNSEALLHLGMIGNPTTGKQEKNLPLAKYTIDTLGMLEEKTRGNLTDDEAAMLKNILYDLRMIYVRETT